MPLTGLEQIIHFNSPELSICEVPSLQLLTIRAIGEVPTAVYRRGVRLAVEKTVEKRLRYWLVSNKLNGIISPADQIWTNEVVAPMLAKESFIDKIAFIKPDELLPAIIIESIMDQARDVVPFEMQFFDDARNGIKWLQDSTFTQF